MISAVIIGSQKDVWVNDQQWMINVINNNKAYNIVKEDEQSYTQIGGNATFELNSILFFLIGIGFGTPFSMTKINLLDWNRTSVPKKIIRTALACGLYVGIFYIFKFFGKGSNYETSERFFYQAMAYLLQGFLIYGPLVFLMEYTNLVDH